VIIGIQQAKAGRYVFFYSVCLLLIVTVISSFITNEVIESSNETLDYSNMAPQEYPTLPAGYGFMQFLQSSFITLSISIFILSIANLFIAKNNRPVKVISGILLGLGLIGLGIFIYFIAIFSKIGG
jgi:hypothetical protein